MYLDVLLFYVRNGNVLHCNKLPLNSLSAFIIKRVQRKLAKWLAFTYFYFTKSGSLFKKFGYPWSEVIWLWIDLDGMDYNSPIFFLFSFDQFYIFTFCAAYGDDLCFELPIYFQA